MSFDPRIETLGGYRPRTFAIDCLRCRRGAELDRYDMLRRFGEGATLAECARKVAALKGCNLAAIHGGPGCSVKVFETAVWTWGRLSDARIGGWQAYLTCHRKLAGLKSTKSCPEVVRLDIPSLTAILGDDYPLDRLQTKMKCPYCGTARVEIEWHVPEPPKTPAPIQEPPEPLRLRPQGAALARTRVSVVKG